MMIDNKGMLLLRKNIIQIIKFCAVLFFSVQVYSAPVPNFDKPVSLTAREQAITVFMQELFGQIDVPVVVDSRVEGKVNASFSSLPAQEVFEDVGRSFGLVVYYDGAVAYIYTANNISQRFLATPKHMTNRILKNVYSLGLTDQQNQLRSSNDGGLVVRGTKRFIEQIEELVYVTKSNVEFYQPPLSFKVFYLKYAWAQDVTMRFGGREVIIPGVASTLRFLTDDSSNNYLSEPVDTLGNTSQLASAQQGLRGQGLANISTEGRLGLDGGAVSPIPVMDAGRLRGPIDSNGESIRIGVDPRLNAIIVRDSPDRMSRYKALIDALDIEPQMLEIEATIIDVNTDRLRELGINWRGIRGDDQLLFGDGSTSDLNLNVDRTITPLGRGGFASFVTGNTFKFIGRINALEAKGAARIASSPHVLTLSNVEAIFDTSSTFYVRLEGEDEVDLFNVSVGTSLRVTPHVFKDNGEAKIKLLITIEDGQQENQSVDNIPVVRRSTINTQALINANESVLIGGLVRETTEESVDKVPLLGDVPVFGNLFKSKTKKAERIERMFLISPRLASSRQRNKERISLLQNQTVEPIFGNADPDKLKNAALESKPLYQHTDFFDDAEEYSRN